MSVAEHNAQGVSFSPVLRFFARMVSVLLHPLFIPVYVGWFLIYIYHLFPASDPGQKGLLLLRFGVMYILFPLVTILLLKGLGFIESIFLRTQKERIIPYVASGMFYFWMWYVLRNQAGTPKALELFALGIFLASSLGLMLNSYFKISMHALAAGVALAFMSVLAFRSNASFGFYLSVALLGAGLVGTARLITGEHRPFEVYAGFAGGILSQLVAYWVLF
ncbi:hypothetical protein SAMN05444008_12350 [Cnuella takakiae]|uniref:PAP2 superfamily protein n=1 Tax=Cnuella takakiae TaxID=1302690 RepID=A0A1M5IE19_9BACT|nr:hypothetical protein [Cnuella takakiae]SHG26594.1 hypothetical protein SAMN05444008_12350 [Cnuella takakiae]